MKSPKYQAGEDVLALKYAGVSEDFAQGIRGRLRVRQFQDNVSGLRRRKNIGAVKNQRKQLDMDHRIAG